MTLSGQKQWIPEGTCGHELSRPKRVSWLPVYGMLSATSIPVACGGVKTHVFMDDEVGLDPIWWRETNAPRSQPAWGREPFVQYFGCVPPFTHAVAQAFEGLAL